MSKSRRLAARAGSVLLAAAAVAVFSNPAPAAVYTWTGTVDSNWASTFRVGGTVIASNWGVLVPPGNAATTDLVFNTSAGGTLNQNIANPFDLNGLTFGTSAGSYVLNGGTLRFDKDGATMPSITNNAGTNQTINEDLILRDALTLNGSGTGTVTLAGVISGTEGLNVGGGSYRISGSSANTFTGAAQVTGGTLYLDKAGAVQGNLTATGGTTWIDTNVFSANSTFTINGGTVYLNTSALTLGRMVIQGGAAYLPDYTATLTSSSPYALQVDPYNGWFGNFRLTSASGGGIRVGDGSSLSGTVDLGGITREVNVDAGTATVSSVFSHGGITKTGAGTLKLTGGSAGAPMVMDILDVEEGATVLSGGALTLTDTGSMGFGGPSSLFIAGVSAGNSITVQDGFTLRTYATPQLHNGASMTVDGAGTTWTNLSAAGGGIGEIRIGYAGGVSTLTVQNGASVSTPGMLVGSLFYSPNPGKGSLVVTSGGSVNVEGLLSVFDSNSSVTVDGGTLKVGGLFTPGGTGTVAISDGSGGPALEVSSDTYWTTFRGNIVDAAGGPGSLKKSGSGILTLAGAGNSYSGNVLVNGGTLQVAAGAALAGSGARVTVANTGSAPATLEVNSSQTIAGLSGSPTGDVVNTVRINGGMGTRLLSSQGTDTTFVGRFEGDGQFAKVGTGTATVGGAGGTLGSFFVIGGDAVIDGSLAPSTNLSLDLTSAGIGNYQEGLLVGWSGDAAGLTIKGGADVNVTHFAVFDGPAGTQVTVTGAGSSLAAADALGIGYDRTASFTADAGATVTAGDLYLGVRANGAGVLNVRGGATVTANQAFFAINPTSTGTATVTGAGSSLHTASYLAIGYAGHSDLTVSNGASVIADGTGTYVNDGSTLTVDRGTFTTTYLSGGGAISLSNPAGADALTVNAPVGGTSFTGTVADGPSGAGGLHTTGSVQLSGPLTYTGATTTNNGTLTFLGTAPRTSKVVANSLGIVRFIDSGYSVAGGHLRSNSGGSIQYNNATVSNALLFGPGGHVLTGNASNFTNVTVFNGAGLQVNADATFTAVTDGGSTTVSSGRTLTWDAGTLTSSGTLLVVGTANVSAFEMDGVLTIPRNGVMNNSSTNLVFGGGSRTSIGSAAVPGGALTLLNGRSLELNGALLVNNGTISGTTNVNFGSVAKGAGTYGSVRINDGGQFSPGNSPGTASATSATFGQGGTYVWEIGSATGTAGTNWDLLQVTGTLGVAASAGPGGVGFTIEVDSLTGANVPGALAGFDPSQAYSWAIASAGTIGGFDARKFGIDTSGFLSPFTGTFSVSAADNTMYLNYSPVPEPGTAVLAALAGGAGVLRRRRRGGTGGTR